MGYVPPPYRTQGPPKKVRTPAPAGVARCAYCGLYGPLGRCVGCGAPNEPAPVRRMVRAPIEVTTFNQDGPVFLVSGEAYHLGVLTFEDER
jgi:hypothetical protein